MDRGKGHHSLSLSLAYVFEAGHERCGRRTWEHEVMTQKHLHTSGTTRQTLVCNPFVFQHDIFYLKTVMLITFLGAGETSLIAELGEKQCPSNLITIFSHVPFSGH